MSKSQREKQKQPWWLGGAAASMAVCFTHPLDQTKYRMQVMHTKAPMLRTLYSFAARDGIPSLWTGLSASILRQSTYSTARFGLYTILSQRLKERNNQPLSSWATILCAGVSGGLAGIIGNPAEVILVRMCADGAKPPSERMHYPDAARGLARIAREEGLATFGRGLTATVVRSVLMNVGQIAPYTAAKQFLLKNTSLKDDVKTHMLSSLIAGTVATTICAPADVLKSRIQSASRAGGSSSVLQVLSQGLQHEGPIFLMKGWTPAWLRLTPHTILTFVFIEKLQDLVNWRATTAVAPVEAKM
ncbi:mitochondrial carrier [Cryphonectria parasitica EP155]|uniref:Mitochondrial carrier n=1 Tax=Cryphonectria parasitica (strain ATCC 38755 / EP155) TaxID=660469 RepID=A0A9P5CLE0_CRYP1|nr:mitochondrial carrier [Cryphonectria parasitica EP155]KAF3763234.1 mitochondrial carrier [Cryphonectria parasitica EP155]